jgi:nicotinamide-nucleotide amidase
MRIELICSGTELLRDKINTNTNTIAEKLAGIGLTLSQVSTVGDDLDDMVRTLREAWARSEVVFMSGGLGPTFDDLTRECAARVLRRKLIFSEPILRHIRARFASIGRTMPEENRRQAYLLQGAAMIPNRKGTAPGQIVSVGKKSLILLPGPPGELIPMMEDTVCPYLSRRHQSVHSQTLVLHVYGFPESEVDERIAPVVEKRWNIPGVKITFGILAHRSIIDVKATAEARTPRSVRKALSLVRRELLSILGEDVYGEDDETLPMIVGKRLKRRGQTLALAESCTGGRIAAKITEVPGSSEYLREGLVTYSNESKVRRLGVGKETLKRHGAVSRETAGEMAKGLLRASGADWALSVTGIAGPGGAVSGKPVGLVWFGLAHGKEVWTVSRNFLGSRTEIQEKSALAALNLLRQKLKR